MLDASNRVHFVNPTMLLVETAMPFPMRFTHIVLITRVVRRYGGGVELLAGGRHYDAASAFELIQSLGPVPMARSFAFTGGDAALRDLGQLCAHLLADGSIGSLPAELAYLRR